MWGIGGEGRVERALREQLETWINENTRELTKTLKIDEGDANISV